MRLDDEDIRSYKNRNSDEKQHAGINGLTIFVATLSAILIAWFIRDAYLKWQVEQVLIQLNNQMAITSAQSQEHLRIAQMRSDAIRLEHQKKIQQQVAEKEQIRLDEVRRIQEDKERAALITQQNAIKESAWKRYYKPSLGCESDNPNRETVKCGNDYIKARKKFEDSWVLQQTASRNNYN